MQYWEYKVTQADVDKIDSVLNVLGKQMWEAVGVTPAPGGKIICVLKRETRTSPSTGKIQVETRKTEAYVPGMPVGTE